MSDQAAPAIRADGFVTYQKRGIRNRSDKQCSGGIGADVSRRRKQKVLGFVVSRIEID